MDLTAKGTCGLTNYAFSWVTAGVRQVRNTQKEARLAFCIGFSCALFIYVRPGMPRRKHETPVFLLLYIHSFVQGRIHGAQHFGRGSLTQLGNDDQSRFDSLTIGHGQHVILVNLLVIKGEEAAVKKRKNTVLKNTDNDGAQPNPVGYTYQPWRE